jgi:hypothetical protein
MKKINPIVVFLFIILLSSFAGKDSSESKSGIYLTENDYINHRISYAGADKIMLNKFTAGDNVKIIINGESKKIAKKDIYGFHSSDNNDFRFYKNELYQIVESEKLFVYKNYATTSLQGGKGSIKQEFFYYSLKGNEPLIPLTISNLRKSFSNNIKFQELLDTVKSDEELTYYVTYMQQLKVEYLFKKSQE